MTEAAIPIPIAWSHTHPLAWVTKACFKEARSRVKTRGTSSAAEPLALPGAVKNEVKVDWGKLLQMMDLLFMFNVA